MILLIALIFSTPASAKPTLEMQVTYGDRVSSFQLENETLKFSAKEQGETDTRSVKLSKTKLDELKKKLAALEKIKPSEKSCSRANVTVKTEKFEKKECLSNSKSATVEFTNWVSRQIE
jgi:hypothetical protein